MVRIFVIKDTEAFIKGPVFRQMASRVNDKAVIVLSSMEGLEDLVKKGSVEALAFAPYTEDERTSFVRDYTEFIASLNARYKEKFLWWATDISSKNGYFCFLPDLIQELLAIERGLEKCKDKPLVIIAPSVSIEGALQKLMVKYGRKLSWPGCTGKRIWQCTIGAGGSVLRLLIRALRFYIRSLTARVILRQYAAQLLSMHKEFYVVKTFSYPSSWDSNGNYADTYFGRLPRILSNGQHVLILTYHWQGYQAFIKRVSLESQLNILPVEFFFKASDVLRAVLRILAFRLPVAKEVYFRDLDITDVLHFELVRTMNGIQVFQLLHYDAIRSMLKVLHAGTFLFTFENNPWERMCILACRHHSPATKLIGYQHSVVPEAALNMFIHPLEKNIVPLPHRILTTGEIPKEIIQYYGDYSLVPVMSACALRYEYLSQMKLRPRQKSRGRILLVLDGVNQTQQMLKFVIEQLGGNSQYTLRIRCHPALPWNLLSHKFHVDLSRYSNIEISQENLQEDLYWSDMIIYWQTAVVLEAMSLGKPAINFKTNDILSYDPLFQSNALKWTVTENSRLLETIAAVEDMDESTYQEQCACAKAYIQRYFYPVVPESLTFFKFD